MFEATAYTPVDEAMGQIMREALSRYQTATGRDDLETDVSTGIPVLWMHDIWVRDIATGDDIQLCANTVQTGFLPGRLYTQAIYVDPDPPPTCGTPLVSLLHELIHSLAVRSNHVADKLSLFYGYYNGATKIDESALTELCAHFDCYAFNPESQ